MNTRIDSLHLIQAACWQELQRGVREREHGWHLMTVATVDGDAADARTVVLRDVRPHTRCLVFYTDDRSAKVAQLRTHPQGTLLLWSPALSWQLRLRVVFQVEDSGLDVSSRWAQVKLSRSAQDYMSSDAPGTPLARMAAERGSREHFAVVTARVQRMDWLELHPDGQRRAEFDDQGAHWLVP